jgi:hypothetical protein
MSTIVERKRYEIWVQSEGEKWRLNARFSHIDRATHECGWYSDRGVKAEIRIAP